MTQNSELELYNKLFAICSLIYIPIAIERNEVINRMPGNEMMKNYS